jgi:hypothetical protein
MNTDKVKSERINRVEGEENHKVKSEGIDKVKNCLTGESAEAGESLGEPISRVC